MALLRRNDHRDLFVAVFCLMVAATWLLLMMWQASGYSHYILHGPQAHGVHFGMHDSEPLVYRLGLYSLGWLLMCIAMMLPTSLPLIQMFRRLTASRRDRGQLLVILMGGYLGVWLVFGVIAHMGQWWLYQWLSQMGELQSQLWLVSAGLLLVAGLFQFSSFKYQCLDKCRSPLSFVNAYWRGHHERRQTLLLAVHHGLFCLGCCWALMLLMFAVGTGGVVWMMLLGLVMAAEKNLSWGRRLAAPLGIGLVSWAGVIVILQFLPR